jgi:hypothetical protein
MVYLIKGKNSFSLGVWVCPIKIQMPPIAQMGAAQHL